MYPVEIDHLTRALEGHEYLIAGIILPLPKHSIVGAVHKYRKRVQRHFGALSSKEVQNLPPDRHRNIFPTDKSRSIYRRDLSPGTESNTDTGTQGQIT